MIFEIPGLINKTGVDFINAFKGIPKKPPTSVLNLGNCNLAAKRASDITTGFVTIPPNIETMYLNNNDLYLFNDKELLDIIQSIPNTVTSLNLTGNRLNTKAGAVLTKLLSMKPSIKSLGLSYNNLVIRHHNRNSSQKNISPGAVTHRARGSAGSTVKLFSRGESLAQFTLPGAVVEEFYELNRPEKAAAALAEAFKTMSDGVTSLDLSFNNFYSLPGSLLAKIFASLTQSLRTLNVSGNGLGTKRPNDKESEVEFSKKIKLYVMEAFKSLKHIRSLDISQNDLYHLTAVDLIDFISSFPEQIKEIIISESDIAKLSSAELTELAKILYRHDRVLKMKNAQAIICGVIGSVEILDRAFIPSMYSEATVPFTVADASSLGAKINFFAMEMLFAQKFSIETYNIFLEYLNIRLCNPILRAVIPTHQTLTVTSSVTRTTLGTSPSGSPVPGTPSVDLNLVVASPSHKSAGGASTQRNPGNKPASGEGVAAAAATPVGAAVKYVPRHQGLFSSPRNIKDEQNSSTNSCICS